MTQRPVATTRAHPFSPSAGPALFSVNAGVPIHDALQRASNMLSCVHELVITISDGDTHGQEIFAVQYLTEMAKALVDAAGEGVWDKEHGQ
ncbi:DUF3077 domain-containing protein [Pseudomonas aeruginosa]|uniref:DUF3077 domain-containing protein n=1 Tax=Pseudomonas aeruginosa TaxID=287 RepID=UPI0018C67028|nr:DUF3077 domain-containing protein [Pseudomonas aeruginosa]EIU7092026.1 DUF3077 domain-containing protein [Pseudomonas aeruginosa]MBG5269993.1 DUF3077 domain-containing protein [Pseudomonas aeruginosa]MBG6564630.1 DUF3077 domain-containing protein [Pseudomonas aeruginosa]MBR7580271.1 DUF3077 domain-containing protein [Pseudomonas aeruginosa]MCV4097209.1 DUF3077 domain-containing protein [Pseudomonas aeruginosa]